MQISVLGFVRASIRNSVSLTLSFGVSRYGKVTGSDSNDIERFRPRTERFPLLQWIQNSDDGFPHWRGRSTRMLYPGYPLVDLICDKEQSAPSDIYLAEIYDDSGAELLRGLSLYRLIDEMVIFLLPVISSETVPVSKHISTDKWELVRTKHL